jgi:chloramphenicol O-acetyltransferase type A
MATYLDLQRWPRRAAFEYFRAFDKPYFSVCTRVDVARLKAALGRSKAGGLGLACYHAALLLAHEIEAFRYRLERGQVRVLDRVDGSTTVLREDESFGFATLRYDPDFETFAARAGGAIAAARENGAAFEPQPDEQAFLHFTTLPWVHFTSFSHARNWGREDAVPKISFGRADAEGARLMMPLSVEVHHALMDGLHLGRFVQRFEELLNDPEPWLAGPKGISA